MNKKLIAFFTPFFIGTLILVLSYYSDADLVKKFTWFLASTFLVLVTVTLYNLRDHISSLIDDSYGQLQQRIDEQHNLSKKLYSQISKDAEKLTFKGKILRLHDLDSRLFTLGERFLNDSIKSTTVTEGTFYVSGEMNSLKLYSMLWDQLIAHQRKVNHDLNITSVPNIEENDEYDLRRLVVRATHSNDISIFFKDSRSSSSDIVESFLEKQKEFVSQGGIIERIFLGKDSEANNDYKEVMTDMSVLGIGVHYLPIPGEYRGQYDFAWISTNEINRINDVNNTNYVAKWYSEHLTDKLGTCEIHDGVEDVVYTDWDNLGRQVEDQSKGFDKIPNSRQIR